MWRSVIISNGEKISTHENWLVVTQEDGSQESLPILDLYCVVIDNTNLSITVPTLLELVAKQVHVILCDSRHLPSGEIYPLNPNYHALHILKRQMQITDDFKSEVWQTITRRKIENQAICLDNAFVDRSIVDYLFHCATEVRGHDRENVEGRAAKVFFQNLYSQDFKRFQDDPINQALNYGYAIIRSCAAKALVSYGFNCALGIHHCSEVNEFNLADDLMEPFRPLVDQYIASDYEEFQRGLDKKKRSQLVNLINSRVIFRGKRMQVRNAIELSAKSLATAFEYNQPSRFCSCDLISEDFVCG
ncbi:MAG: type II CRISPR-associated endonuclease Cas1 [Clostridiales bacterium]|nr:type II CRISPR-associated endonuclease Cas1 [Clostridiales bacterium]